MIRGRRFSRRRIDRWLRGELALGELLRLKVRDHEDLVMQAHRRLESGDLAAARRLFELLGQLSTEDSTVATLGQGVCLQRDGDLAAAERAYDRVLDLEPKNLYALANRAEVRLLTDRKDAARVDLEVALSSFAAAKIDKALRQRIEKLKALADQEG